MTKLIISSIIFFSLINNNLFSMKPHHQAITLKKKHLWQQIVQLAKNDTQYLEKNYFSPESKSIFINFIIKQFFPIEVKDVLINHYFKILSNPEELFFTFTPGSIKKSLMINFNQDGTLPLNSLKQQIASLHECDANIINILDAGRAITKETITVQELQSQGTIYVITKKRT